MAQSLLYILFLTVRFSVPGETLLTSARYDDRHGCFAMSLHERMRNTPLPTTVSLYSITVSHDTVKDGTQLEEETGMGASVGCLNLPRERPKISKKERKGNWNYVRTETVPLLPYRSRNSIEYEIY